MTDRVYKIILVAVVLLLVVVLGYSFFYDSDLGQPVPQASAQPTEIATPSSSATPSLSAEEPVFCTQDAMECPDGSYVGRVAPDCAFAPCPSVAPR